MRKTGKRISAGILILLMALPAIVEGGSVLSGISKPEQIVLKWLVYYNVSAAIVSLAGIFFLFRRPRAAIPFSLLILTSHAAVLGILLYILLSSGNVANKSIAAMSIRSVVWLVVLFLARKSSNEE